jgi:rhodanese-related sulfurtransferase
MRKAGIANVHALKGGWDTWLDRGGKVAKGDKP